MTPFFRTDDRYSRSRARVSATYSSRRVSCFSRSRSASSSPTRTDRPTRTPPRLTVDDHAHRTRQAARALRHVHDEHDRELEPFRGVDGHQVHGVERLDARRSIRRRRSASRCGRRSARASRSRDSGSGGSRPRIFFRFSQACCRRAPRSSYAYAVVGEDLFDQIGRAARDRPARATRGTCARTSSSTRRSSSSSAGDGRREPRVRRAPRRASGPSAASAAIRHPDESRSQERRGAQIRRGIREKAHQRRHILDLVRVEEAEALVDVGRDAARARARCSNSRWLVRDRNRIAMSPGVRGARHAGLAVAHVSSRRIRCDLGGDGRGARVGIVRGAPAPSTGPPRPSSRAAVDRKPIGLAVGEVVGAPRPAAPSRRTAR